MEAEAAKSVGGTVSVEAHTALELQLIEERQEKALLAEQCKVCSSGVVLVHSRNVKLCGCRVGEPVWQVGVGVSGGVPLG
jgi:hypothetical protein